MEILQDIVQGTDAWHQIRAKHFTASEASAMMGESRYMTRSALLEQKHSGIVPDVDSAKQYLFNKGHAAEAAARPIVEGIIGEELYPCTATAVIEGLPLLASFDGVTMDESIVWECKLFNQDLLLMVEQGDLGTYCWQLEQQLLVAVADKVYFTTSDGTPNGTHGCWYKSDPVKRAKLIYGWHQFAEDLKNYMPTEKAAPVVVHVEALPAVSVRLGGELTVASNLPEFGVALRDFIKRIPAKPSTDQEFADCDSACKSLKKAEDALESAENNAIAQMTDFEAMRRATSDLKELARATRLACEKLVKIRKDAVKMEIINEAKYKLDEHITSLNKRTSNMMPSVPVDLVSAAKNRRNIDSLRDAVNLALAHAKIEANEIADLIQTNLETPGLHGYKFLFADLSSICTKANDDFVNTVNARISAHEAKESERITAETARIRAEVEKQERDRVERDALVAAEKINAQYIANANALSQARALQDDPPDTQETYTVALNKTVSGISMLMDHADRMDRVMKPQRASTRSIVDNILNRLNDDQMQEVARYLQANFTRLAA